jgi:ABC-type phosphate transport system substrate-binding protein
VRFLRKSLSQPPWLPYFPLYAGLAAVCLLVTGARTAAESPEEVVVVVSARSPTTDLARNELADLFLGRVAHFPDGRPAVPINQTEGNAARAQFNSAYLGRTAAQIKAHWSKVIFTGRGSPPRALASSEEVRRRIAADPNAIGYLERRMVDASLKIVRVE